MIKYCDRKQLTEERVYPGFGLSPRLEFIVSKEHKAAGGRSRKLAGHVFHPYTGSRGGVHTGSEGRL